MSTALEITKIINSQKRNKMKMSSGFDSALLGLGIRLNPKKGRKVKVK